MNNFDKLQISSLKNDGFQYWKQGTQNWKKHSISYGTQAGGGFHTLYIYPFQIPNAAHLQIDGTLINTDLVITLIQGDNTYPEFWDTTVLDGKELFLTMNSSVPSPGNKISVYWNGVSGPKLLDEVDISTFKNKGVLINWFDGEAYATHIYSKP